jgi:hypothetical protein
MDEVRVACSLPRSPCEREQEKRQEQGEPRSPPEIADDAVAESDPEMPERRRGDDLQLQPAVTNDL